MKIIVDKSTDSRFILFSLVWAIATLFHYQAFHKWGEGVFVWMAAIWLILNPSQTYRLVLLALLQVIEAGMHLPLKHNHWLLATLINLTILIALVVETIRKRSFRYDQADLYNLFSPYLRVELIILYFFAVFHKLNVDFFNPLISCGAYFYQTQATRFTFLPDSQFLEILCMASTLFFEICIPLLLLSSSRRNLGVLVALLFHGIIGFNPTSEFWNFSALVYALLILFTPGDFPQICIDRFKAVVSIFRKSGGEGLEKYGKVIAPLCLFFFVASLILIDDHVFEVVSGLVLWTLYMVVAIAVFTRIGWKRIIREEASFQESKFHFQSYLMLLLPLMTFLNGTSPYWGLKTESSYAMFSNLRTEGGVSNHFIIPSSWQLFEFQKDLVAIEHSSDDYLESLSEKGLLLPYFEFKRYMQSHPQASVTFVRNSQTFRLNSIQDDPDLLRQDPWYYRAFLIFRPVTKQTPTPCTR